MNGPAVLRAPVPYCLLMSTKTKVTIVALMATFALGGLAPAASARKTIGEQMGTAVQRMETAVDRVEERTVGNVRQEVRQELRDVNRFVQYDMQREILELGAWVERTLNPRV